MLLHSVCFVVVAAVTLGGMTQQSMNTTTPAITHALILNSGNQVSLWHQNGPLGRMYWVGSTQMEGDVSFFVDF